jgi:hypothetical protein
VRAVVGLLALLGTGRRTRLSVALVAIIGFVIQARPSPSVLSESRSRLITNGPGLPVW